MNDVKNEENNTLVLDTVEKKLDEEVSVIEQRAKAFVITNDKEYEEACETTKLVKQMQKKVVDYWEPLRVSAHKTYNDILAHKKEMLNPLESAEKILKNKISTYSLEQEKKREAEENAMRKLAEAEVDKKIAEAQEAEKNGDVQGYEYAMAEAEVMETVATSGRVTTENKKIKGVSTKKAWKITGVDSSKVPVNFNGMELRPVDLKLVNQLIKASNGSIEIPGITYEETNSISIRA